MIICIDLETTGLDKYSDEIIEIAMVKFNQENFEIIESFSTFIKPTINIPDIISNITNIFDSDVQDAPVFNEIKKEIINFIWDTPLLWHNVFFDRNFLIQKWINIKGNIVIDTFFLANFLHFNSPSLNLEMLCKFLEIPFSWMHRAFNDVNATISLFKKLIENFNKLKSLKKDLLYFIFNSSDDVNIEYLKNFLFKDFNKEIDYWKFENSILKQIWKYEDDWKIIVDKDFDISNMSTIFKKLWKLEIRENQSKMMQISLETLINSKKSVIEAPTWLWKTFAYLMPSIIHSLKTWEKVFISTKTKTLQDQLFYKDLSFLDKHLNVKFKYTKLKWRNNYLSIKWFFNEFTIPDINYEKIWLLSKILLWLFETKYWELDELNYFWIEFTYLKFLNSNVLFYKGNDSNYTNYEFLYKARRKLEESNIVIINHSLLFADIKADNSILGKLENLVIDEAHSIEDSITDSLKKRASLKLIEDTFLIIENIFKKKEIKKIKFLKIKEELFSNLDLIFDYCFSYINSKTHNNNNYKTILITRDFFENINFEDILKKININFILIIDYLWTIEEFDFTKEKLLLNEIEEFFNIILDNKSDKLYIKIINYNDNNWVFLEYTLLNPWKYLEKNLYNKMNSIILTSATLKIWDSFEYFKKLLYLNNFDFYSFESDFDYNKQATLFIPTDLGNIKNNSNKIIEFLSKFYNAVQWNTLTLLTSFSIIRKIYTSLNINLKNRWINIYAQSIWWSKVKLINSFLALSSNSILLGTDSFWEWVDIPWNSLKYLIIHKFPFSVPTDPVFIARSVFFKDPFNDYSVPKAIIKLKQGFWRLIRGRKDKWLVVLLDDRIINTLWWKQFFNSFPVDINIKKWKSDQLIDILNNY